MIQLPAAQEWVRYAESFWWNPEDILSPIRLSEHVAKIISVLEASADAGDSERVWMEIERVRAKYITMPRFEAGVAQQKCARIALEMGYDQVARELFYDARDNLSRGDSHHYAIASWMLGCVYWLKLNGQQNKAIDVWQEAIDIFLRLEKNAATNTARMLWYKQTRSVMAEALKLAIELERLPSLDEISGAAPIPAGPVFMADVTDQPPFQEFPIPIENYFQLFVVYDEIPAGLPGPVAYQPSPMHPAGHSSLSADDYLEVTRVRIGERDYQVNSLARGKNRVNLISDKPHFILRVRGNSMNLAGIDDGDLVVVRSQMIADDNQIVAAEIIGVDVSRATLKRYSRRGKTVILKAESTDPEFSDAEWMFTRDSENVEDGFYLRGIALAVLKPIP